MPPYMYWPDEPWDVVFHPAAFDNGVSELDIRHILSQHPSHVFRSRGESSLFDAIFSGGKVVARPTMATGRLPGGQWVEVGFRRDFREAEEVCFVFHAQYV